MDRVLKPYYIKTPRCISRLKKEISKKYFPFEIKIIMKEEVEKTPSNKINPTGYPKK